MKPVRFHPTSLLAGCGLAALAFLAMGQSPVSAPQSWQYRVVEDVNATEARELSDKGWEFVGYLGESKRGVGIDETLWRLASK